MSDSGRTLGDCQHGRTREHCSSCASDRIAELLQESIDLKQKLTQRIAQDLELQQARDTNRRLNRRCQSLESEDAKALRYFDSASKCLWNFLGHLQKNYSNSRQTLNRIKAREREMSQPERLLLQQLERQRQQFGDIIGREQKRRQEVQSALLAAQAAYVELEAQLDEARQLLLDSNLLIFAADGTLEAEPSLLQLAKAASEKIPQLRKLHAELLAEAERLHDDNERLKRDAVFESLYDAATAEVEALRAAIRKHMNMRGDDRCYQDDHDLYTVLPEQDTRPERETLVTIENCQRYIECRMAGRVYASPQRQIEELEQEVLRLQQLIEGLAERCAGQSALLTARAVSQTDQCEHGVDDGMYCKPCNDEVHRARREAGIE